ncbi:MAG: hypothetical protein MMC33_004258 [Icmadophila ericetorum]|nr:hypothetical protein [Icmadophila ericetorum]
MPLLAVRASWHGLGVEAGQIIDLLRQHRQARGAAYIKVVESQNNLTQQVLSTCDTRSRFKALMTEMYDFPKTSCPFQRGEPGGVLRWYYNSNSGLQAQSVLYTSDAPDADGGADGKPQVLLDPNTFSADGTIALGDYAFSYDGRYIAYSISSGGSDWQKILIKQINPDGSSFMLNDTLSNVKFSTTAWAPDNKVPHSLALHSPGSPRLASTTLNPGQSVRPLVTVTVGVQYQISLTMNCVISAGPSHKIIRFPGVQGFFYNQYPAPNITGFGERGTNTGANNDQQLWYHEVGTSQDKDFFVMALPEHPTWSVSASFTYARE